MDIECEKELSASKIVSRSKWLFFVMQIILTYLCLSLVAISFSHNWRHALNVAQTMFAMMKTGKMERFMKDLEILGLLVACVSYLYLMKKKTRVMKKSVNRKVDKY